MINPNSKERALELDHKPPKTDWMDTPTVFKEGIYCYAAYS
jgi:hypothetical protein